MPNQEGKFVAMTFPPFTSTRAAKARRVATLLRGGQLVSDDAFDEIYPAAIRAASFVHWTPMRVCERVVRLLRLHPGRRLLDVGAGAGKLAIVAAALSGASVRGVERRPELVAVAREAARRFGIEVTFHAGEFADEDPHAVDALYIFNPFIEVIRFPGIEDLPPGEEQARTAADIAAAESFLRAARSGTQLVTFCGFGGSVANDYELQIRETWDDGALDLWTKR